MTLTVRLPIPPSTNNLFVNVPGKGRVMSSAYRDWKDVAGPIVRRAWKKAGSPMFNRHLNVTLRVGMDYTGDIMNREKATTDIVGQIIPHHPDDRYIDRYVVERDKSIKGDVVIVIEQMQEPS